MLYNLITTAVILCCIPSLGAGVLGVAVVLLISEAL
jgi:hypothetical protein